MLLTSVHPHIKIILKEIILKAFDQITINAKDVFCVCAVQRIIYENSVQLFLYKNLPVKTPPIIAHTPVKK